MLLDHYGRECWSARDLQVLMGYSKWQDFEKVIENAKSAVSNSGIDERDHFTGARKVITGGRWGTTEVNDHRLTRFGAYQVALAGDGRKPEVAAAKTYFAVKAREAEVSQMPDLSTPDGVVSLAEHFLATAKELASAKKELEVAKPKAGKWDAFLNSEGLIGMTELADLLRTDVRTLTGWLVDEGIFRQQKSQNGGNRNMPRKAYQDSGHFEVKTEHANRRSFPSAYATPVGIDLVADRWNLRRAA
ncbi:phage antirepressor KilAC domain-containing protein [Streptomyces sp. NRRL F-5630]|uniref:phage antirepressor KilAC domain-containing protein n=1 Tax=Streptomyces sp. NRRL F-5630 TaxID=1463864 RepID=UPI003EBB5CCA